MNCWKAKINYFSIQILKNILDNIQIVTKEINLAKHVLSQEDFINMCKKVVNHANQQPSTPLTKCEGSETNP